ncbi:MAG: hypothetical protein GX595_13245 [Lentisphaerae bacterium]|nr:hypothetical protein [Lentisphaerota bacterium]
MRAASIMWAAVLMAAVVSGGCARPRLASRPLTDVESEWGSYIRASYPGWRPPYYSPAQPLEPSQLALPAAPAPTSSEFDYVPAEPRR